MSAEAMQGREAVQSIAEIDAEVRAGVGRQACRRLRREWKVPANLYGHKKANVLLAIPEAQFVEQLAGGRRLLNLNFSGSREIGMVKEVQYDAVGDRVVHVDFARVSLDERVHFRVPVGTVGIAKGAAGGGIFDHMRKELDIEGPATEIPQRIELDVSELSVGDMIRVRDVPLPPSCKILHTEPDDAVVAVHAPRRVEEPKPEGEAAEVTEPEVVGKEGRKEAEDEEEKEDRPARKDR